MTAPRWATFGPAEATWRCGDQHHRLHWGRPACYVQIIQFGLLAMATCSSDASGCPYADGFRDA
jgi:hypothetical protein